MDNGAFSLDLWACRQRLKKSAVTDPASYIRKQVGCAKLRDFLGSASRVGVCVGSRGIAAVPAVVKETVSILRQWGMTPYIIPAMGSHGGATAEGQRAMIEETGVTEDFCGTLIRSGMEVVDLGPTPEGYAAYMDAQAAAMDALILINRVKEHTDFFGKTESGIVKMAVVGLGNHEGATYMHNHGLSGLTEYIPAIASHQFAVKKIAGLAIVEDGYGTMDSLSLLCGAEIPDREAELLKTATKNKAKIPFHRLDCLYIQQTGKNISGAGVDCKVIGRIRCHGVPEPASPNPSIVCALRLTPESHGNAAGMGLMDVVPQKFLDAVDYEVTLINGLSTKCPERYKTPMVLGTEQQAMEAALSFAKVCAGYEDKIVLIQSTGSLEQLYISEALQCEAQSLGMEVAAEAVSLRFSQNGDLVSKLF